MVDSKSEEKEREPAKVVKEEGESDADDLLEALRQNQRIDKMLKVVRRGKTGRKKRTLRRYASNIGGFTEFVSR